MSSAVIPPCPVCAAATEHESLFETTDRTHGIAGTFTLLRCRGCGVVTYTPRLTDDELARYYQADYYAYAEPPPAPAWLDRLRTLVDDVHLGLRRGLALRVAFAPILWYKHHYAYARHLVGVPPGRLLDVGCGNAAFLTKARRLGFACWGIERGVKASPWLERQGIAVVGAAEAARATGMETISLVDATLESLDGFDGFFDTITLNHVFEHLQDPAAGLRAIDRLLAPGGRVLVRMPNTDSLAFRRWPRWWFALETPRHTYLFDRANFSRLAARHGFEVVSARPEMATLHWQYSLKARLFGRLHAERHWLDSPLLSYALLPLAEVFNQFGWSDMMAVWLRRAGESPVARDASRAAD